MTAAAALTVLFAIAAAWAIAAAAVILIVAPRLARARREQTRPNLVLVGSHGALRKAGVDGLVSETTASQSSVVEAREALSERENAVRKYLRPSQLRGNCTTDSDWPQGARTMPNAPRSESAPASEPSVAQKGQP